MKTTILIAEDNESLFIRYQEIIAKGGVGMLHRSLFQTQRVKKSKHN